MSSCPKGAVTQIDAYVPRDVARAGIRIDMTACFGAGASAGDRAGVQSMLESLRIAS
jgi:hypothetical protein